MMEHAKTLIDHAQEYRNIALAFRRPDIRELLIKAANFCERIAAELAIETAREDELEAAADERVDHGRSA